LDQVVKIAKSPGVARAAYLVSNVTRRTEERHNMIRKAVKNVKDPVVLLEAWRRVYAASTVLSYARTLQAMKPDLKVLKPWKTLLDRVRQDAGQAERRQARPITSEQIAGLPSNSPVSRQVMLLFLSASRHADLERLTHYHWAAPIITMRWKTFKSDRYGERRVTKFVEVPRKLWNWIDRVVPRATYREVLNTLKRVNAELTVHSCRRGAMTALAEEGFSHKEIRLLSAHTPTEDPELAVRRYIDASPNQPEGLKQREMSRHLAKLVLRHLHKGNPGSEWNPVTRRK
jgi:hypothetical protein